MHVIIKSSNHYDHNAIIKYLIIVKWIKGIYCKSKSEMQTFEVKQTEKWNFWISYGYQFIH